MTHLGYLAQRWSVAETLMGVTVITAHRPFLPDCYFAVCVPEKILAQSHCFLLLSDF